MAQVIFHLGFPKTGTTTIQSTISVNRALISKTVWFRLHGGKTRALRDASRIYQRRDRESDRVRLHQLLCKMGDKITESGLGIALISDELLVASHMARKDCLDYVQSAERVLPMIVEAMPQHDVQFVFYSRQMDKWLKSAYQQFVKTRRIRVGLDEWTAGLTFPLDWDEISKRLKAATSRPLDFIAMETEIGPGKVLGQHLFRLIGLSEAQIGDLKIPETKNVSLSPGALEFMLSANASEIDQKDMWKIRKLVIENPDCFR